MIQKPAIDDLVKKTDSKYGLCVVCSKRAREILDRSLLTNEDTFGKDKPLSKAANEIDTGKVVVSREL